MKSRKRSCRSIRVSHIPDDVIVNILSWLPVKCVLRCKCVCKSWKRITEWSVFIEMHRSRSKCEFVYEVRYKSSNGNDYYKYICYRNGLVLEKNEITGEYRIRNPATKQVVKVESPQRPRVENPSLGFDSSTNKYKLINMHRKQPFDLGVASFSIFTFGTQTDDDDDDDDDDDGAWLDDLTFFILGTEYFHSTVYNDTCYFVNFCYAMQLSDIIRFTLDGKSSMNMKLPQSFLSAQSDLYVFDRFQAFFVDNDELAVGFIIEQELHAWVWVVENENEIGIWSEKKIIPLDFMKDYPNHPWIHVRSLSKSKMKVAINNHLLQYDIHSKKYTYLAKAPPGKWVLYELIPCLVSLKGMHSEDRS